MKLRSKMFLLLAIPVAMVLFSVAMLLFSIVQGIAITRADAKCLAAGFPKANLRWDFHTLYCIKRVNQTDVVVRYDTLRVK